MTGTRLFGLILVFWPGLLLAAIDVVPADSLRAVAEVALESGHPEAAREAIEGVIGTQGETAEDWLVLGRVWLDLEDWDAARKAFGQAVDRGAKAEGYNGIGLAYLASGRGVRSAEAHFRRALKEDRGFAQAQYNLARAYLVSRPRNARDAFEKALEIDGHHSDASYQIGLILEKEGRSAEAISVYQQQLEAKPDHREAAFRLAKLWLGLGRREEAGRRFQELYEAGEAMADPACLELAVLSLEDEKFEQAQELFQVCLDRLPAAERKNYRDLLLVATPEELAQYEHTPEGQREEMIRRFWNRRDPTPLTEANERLLEHYRRVAYAREFFGREPYSWDARGDVYIRLGAPDHISRWNDIQAEMELDLQDARVSFVNRARIGLAIRPGQPIFPVSPNARWEYWIYKDVDGGIEITFTQEFEGRRFDYAPYPHGIAPSLGVQLAYFQGNAVIQRVVGRRPAIYAPDFADLPIDFFYYPASYRGAGGQTLLEIYYGLPASEVARLNVDEKTDLIVLDRGVALFDRMWNEVYRVKDQLAFAAPSNQQIEDGAFIPGVLSVDLPAGDYHMALQVRDVLSGKSQVYQQEIRLDEYGGSETLRMSDIELAFVIAPTEDQGEYVKQGLKVIPMSSRSFRRTQNAFVYFEIYDLKLDEFGQTRYRVEYKIRSREKRSAPARIARGLGKLLRVSEKDEEIEIAYDQTGDRKNEVAYVELDLTKTHVGAQQVEVEVTDLVTDEKVSKEILFKIVP